MLRWRALAGWAALVTVAFVLAVAARRGTGNFGVLIDGQVYRSGQMRASQLGRTIRQYRIKTVLNLRGANPKEAWYRNERQTTLNAGATQIDIPMASDQWLARDQLKVILEVLETCEPPVLVHCEWGAERTGLVSAFRELLRPGGTLESARSQFSVKYLYLPIRDGLMMRGHLDRYASWLADQHIAHTPAAFRRWVAEGYRPGSPSREQWPYNPYPLVVVTRPDPQREDTRATHASKEPALRR